MRDTECHARAAAEKVKFDLELLPEYMDAPSAMAPDAIEIHPGTPNIYYEPHIEKGEETAPFFDDPENVWVEDSFYTQRQPHLNIEPDVGYGYINDKGQVVIHSKSVGLHLHALMIAPGLGLEFPKDLVLVQNTTGGTFGYKFSPPWKRSSAWPSWPPDAPAICATTMNSSSSIPASVRPSGPPCAWPPTRRPAS